MKRLAAALAVLAVLIAAAVVAPTADAAQRCWFQFKGDDAPSETSPAIVGAANCQPKPEAPAKTPRRKVRVSPARAADVLDAKLGIVR